MSDQFSVGAMNQLGDALEKAGFTPKEVTMLKQYKNLGGIRDLLYGRSELVAVASKILEAPKETQSILEFLGESTITLTSDRFVANDHFVVDMSARAKVKISYLGDNFKANFLGMVEETTKGGKITVRHRRLLKDSWDKEIIAQLGAGPMVTTPLVAIFALMAEQGNGENGTLLTNGYANIFYIRDANGTLWAVLVSWFGGGWDVNAHSVSDPGGWYARYRVFSC